MSPRDVILNFLAVRASDFLDEQLAETRADKLLAALKAEGLFIGPLVATPEMATAGDRVLEDFSDATGAWKVMSEEWLRTEGA